MQKLHTIRDAEGNLIDAGVHPFDTLTALRQHGLLPRETDPEAFEAALRNMGRGSTLHLKTEVFVRRVK